KSNAGSEPNVRFWVKRRHCGPLNGGYVGDMVTPTKHDGGHRHFQGEGPVTDAWSPSALSRRSLLAALAAAPIVTAATEQSPAQTVGSHWYPPQNTGALQD